MCGSASGVYLDSSVLTNLLWSILMAMRKRKSAKAGSGKQAFERHHFNYGRWTKSRFSEAVTVTGPAKMIFLAGIGSEHEQTGKIMHSGDFSAQCQYAYRKLKKVLARNGATIADVEIGRAHV